MCPLCGGVVVCSIVCVVHEGCDQHVVWGCVTETEGGVKVYLPL